MKALKNNQFCITYYNRRINMDGTTQNLILDGQQRLTTVLLAYFLQGKS